MNYTLSPTYGFVNGADIWRLPWLAYNQLYTKDGDIKPINVQAAKPTVSFEELYQKEMNAIGP